MTQPDKSDSDRELYEREVELNDRYGDLYVAQPPNYLQAQIHLVRNPESTRTLCGREITRAWLPRATTVREFVTAIDVVCRRCQRQLWPG